MYKDNDDAWGCDLSFPRNPSRSFQGENGAFYAECQVHNRSLIAVCWKEGRREGCKQGIFGILWSFTALKNSTLTPRRLLSPLARFLQEDLKELVPSTRGQSVLRNSWITNRSWVRNSETSASQRTWSSPFLPSKSKPSHRDLLPPGVVATTESRRKEGEGEEQSGGECGAVLPGFREDRGWKRKEPFLRNGTSWRNHTGQRKSIWAPP